MPSPFPGMDPYLEDPVLWPDVHHDIIANIKAALNPRLRPNYVARVESRVYISDDDDPGRVALFPPERTVRIPDVRIDETGRSGNFGMGNGTFTITEPITITVLEDEIEEAYLAIRHIESMELVTVIEVLSPANKIKGSTGRKSFMTKRREIFASEVHWVEIDLLRDGVPSVRDPRLARCDYRVIVARSVERFQQRCWPILVRHSLPTIGVPLRGEDSEIPLDLRAILLNTYEHGSYDLSIDYSRPPVPPLKSEDAEWAEQLVRAAHLPR